MRCDTGAVCLKALGNAGWRSASGRKNLRRAFPDIAGVNLRCVSRLLSTTGCNLRVSPVESARLLESASMPQISRFFGIVIAMYHDDHQPPHFHARYGGTEIQVRIADGFIIGQFPTRQRGLVLEWLTLHKDELQMNWELLADGKEPQRIAPLERP